jgi:hypothetical protein
MSGPSRRYIGSPEHEHGRRSPKNAPDRGLFDQ